MSRQLAEAPGTPEDGRGADDAWWLAARGLTAAIEQRRPAGHAVAYYEFGEAILEVESDDSRLLERFEQLYGECSALPPFASGEPRVRVVVRRGDDATPIYLNFLQGVPPDPAAGALSLMQPTGVMPPYSVYESPIAGWRLAGGSTRPVLASSGTQVLIDSKLTRPDFLVEYLVTATLAAQPELLIVHAASLRVGDVAALLVGPTHSGKTTLSLHLAARGHAIFGDDSAVIRMATTEVVPWRQAARLRSGPRAPDLAAALAQLGTRRESAVMDDEGSTPVRIGELFPGELPRPTKVGAAFFLNGFGHRASLAPFRFTLDHLAGFDCLASSDMAYKWWGLGHAQRALRLLALRQLLSRMPCWLLTVGTPGETAELIERTMEAQ